MTNMGNIWVLGSTFHNINENEEWDSICIQHSSVLYFCKEAHLYVHIISMILMVKLNASKGSFLCFLL